MVRIFLSFVTLARFFLADKKEEQTHARVQPQQSMHVKWGPFGQIARKHYVHKPCPNGNWDQLNRVIGP